MGWKVAALAGFFMDLCALFFVFLGRALP